MIKMQSIKFSRLALASLLFIVLIKLNLSPAVEARDKGGDDIILAKGKIIMRGGKGKGNIILDPGNHESGGYHEPMMMPMMFNPYAFYPMQVHHQQLPQMMINPVYVEDHSSMNQNHQEEEHKQSQKEKKEQHHQGEPEQQHYQNEEPQYEQHLHMQHVEEPQYHQQEHEQHEQNSMMGHHHEMEQEDNQEPQYGASGQQQLHQNPYMALMQMHGSGLQPSYQQMAVMQAFQGPAMYNHAPMPSPHQQAAAHYHAQQIAAVAAAAESDAAAKQGQQQQQGELKEASTSTSSQQHSSGSSDQVNAAPSQKAKFSLLEKSAKNPLVQMIKPLFKRHNDSKNASKDQKAN